MPLTIKSSLLGIFFAGAVGVGGYADAQVISFEESLKRLDEKLIRVFESIADESNNSEEPWNYRPATVLEKKAVDDGPRELIVLFPQEGNPSTSIIVSSSGGKTVILDAPYAGALIGGGQIAEGQVSQDDISDVFGETLAAMPVPPRTFRVYFQHRSTDITAQSEAELEELFADLKTRKVAEIDVVGHTDTTGSRADNDKLSLQRANFVRDHLISKGLTASSITASGRGERELLKNTADSVEELENRRVEVTIR
jgi:OOP family OmpA-OmpF porin